MSLYFNEFDPFAAAWLRQLMADGHLEPGIVDERSIADVEADDVRGHRRQHYFAGIGGWELALDLAGWPRGRSVFTGSCPCQPYSSAGKRKGNADERDLWPVFFRLIRECRPECVFGEQVSAAIRFGWLDRLQADMEAEGYTVGACVLGAHSAGADHQRQRLYWVAHTGRDGLRTGRRGATDGAPCGVQGADGQRERLRADAGAVRGTERRGVGDSDAGRRAEGDAVPRRAATGAGLPVPTARGVGDTGGHELGRLAGSPPRAQAEGAGGGQVDGAGGVVPRPASRAVWDHWRDAVPILCRDGKARRIPAAQSGVLGVVDGLSSSVGRERVPCPDRFPLAGKTPNRAGRLRGYGNAICVQTAALFVRAFLEAEGGAE